MMIWIAYILVFLALSLIGYLVINTLSNVLLERVQGKPTGLSSGISRLVTPEQLVKYRMLSACIMFVLPVVIMPACGVYQVWGLLVAALVSGSVGFFLPYLYFLFKCRRRLQEIDDGLVTFTLALLNGLKSGMSFSQSLEATTRRSRGAIREEFRQVLGDQRLGLDLGEAMERLSERVPLEDVRLLVTIVKLTSKTGGSLVEVLTEMIQMMRQRKEFSDKIRSMTALGRFEAMAVSLAPLVGFLILYAINPQLMRPLVTTMLGWICLGAIVLLISIGYYFINKIVTIEV